MRHGTEIALHDPALAVAGAQGGGDATTARTAVHSHG